MSTTDLFEKFDVIDVDTHVTEPPDVWTARTPASMHDKVPHVEHINGQDVWMCDGNRLGVLNVNTGNGSPSDYRLATVHDHATAFATKHNNALN